MLISARNKNCHPEQSRATVQNKKPVIPSEAEGSCYPGIQDPSASPQEYFVASLGRARDDKKLDVILHERSLCNLISFRLCRK